MTDIWEDVRRAWALLLISWAMGACPGETAADKRFIRKLGDAAGDLG